MPGRLQNVDSWLNYVTNHNQAQLLGEWLDTGVREGGAAFIFGFRTTCGSACLSYTVTFRRLKKHHERLTQAPPPLDTVAMSVKLSILAHDAGYYNNNNNSHRFITSVIQSCHYVKFASWNYNC